MLELKIKLLLLQKKVYIQYENKFNENNFFKNRRKKI